MIGPRYAARGLAPALVVLSCVRKGGEGGGCVKGTRAGSSAGHMRDGAVGLSFTSARNPDSPGGESAPQTQHYHFPESPTCSMPLS